MKTSHMSDALATMRKSTADLSWKATFSEDRHTIYIHKSSCAIVTGYKITITEHESHDIGYMWNCSCEVQDVDAEPCTHLLFFYDNPLSFGIRPPLYTLFHSNRCMSSGCLLYTNETVQNIGFNAPDAEEFYSLATVSKAVSIMRPHHEVRHPKGYKIGKHDMKKMKADYKRRNVKGKAEKPTITETAVILSTSRKVLPPEVPDSVPHKDAGTKLQPQKQHMDVVVPVVDKEEVKGVDKFAIVFSDEEVQGGERFATVFSDQKAERLTPVSQEEIDKLEGIISMYIKDKDRLQHKLCIKKFGIDITYCKIFDITPKEWLNDEIINFRFQLLRQRQDRKVSRHNNMMNASSLMRKSHFFNTYFMDKIRKEENVSRWTKKFSIFDLDKVFVPINITNTHWTLLVVFVQAKHIHYYDSMSTGEGKIFMTKIMDWIVAEGKKPSNDVAVDKSQWMFMDTFEKQSMATLPLSKEALYYVQKQVKLMGKTFRYVPLQINSYDCGVFVCMFAEVVCADLPLLNAFSREDMTIFRHKIGTDILRGKFASDTLMASSSSSSSSSSLTANSSTRQETKKRTHTAATTSDATTSDATISELISRKSLYHSHTQECTSAEAAVASPQGAAEPTTVTSSLFSWFRKRL